MTPQEATNLATQLLASYGDRSFDLSMASKEEYDLMRTAFGQLGRETGPDGEFFVVRVFASDGSSNISLQAGAV